MNLEKELKYLLDKRSYMKLMTSVRPFIREQIRQENYYFDTDKLELRKGRFGLRIRISNGKKAFVTFKAPAKFRASKVKSFKVRQEWETQIPLRMAKLILSRKKSILSLRIKPIQMLKKLASKVDLENIVHIGAVKTLRTVAASPDELNWEIDKFKMFKRKFYELEVETENPIETDRIVRYFLAMNHIPYIPSDKSKLGRFFDFWKKKRQPASVH